MVAQVIVDVVHTNVAKPFSYLVPDGMALEVGARVSVPLGRRQVDGFVVELIGDDQLPRELPREKLRPVSKRLDDYPALLPPLLALARELAEEAHCPLSETLRLMLPAAMRTGRIQQKHETFAQLATGVNAEAEAAGQRRAPKRATLLRLLADGKPHGMSELSELVANPRDALRALVESGLISLAPRTGLRTSPAPSPLH